MTNLNSCIIYINIDHQDRRLFQTKLILLTFALDLAAMDDNSTAEPVITNSLSNNRHLGFCKWFDKMKGFGFVQGLDDKRDFFAHHTQINRSPDTSKAFDENVFRYLVAGEYVEFTINEIVTLSLRSLIMVWLLSVMVQQLDHLHLLGQVLLRRLDHKIVLTT